MKKRIAVVAVVLAIAGVAGWWIAGEPGRRSADLLKRLETATPSEAPALMKDLTAVYAGSPRQAAADLKTNASRPEMLNLVAAAAAPVPDCLPAIEKSIDALSEVGRVNLLLTLAINGPPTLNDQGAWNGADPIKPRPDALPMLRRVLDRESSPVAAAIAVRALRAGGDWPPPDEIFKRASDTRRSLVGRTAELAELAQDNGGDALAQPPYGVREIRRALEGSLVPDDAAAAIVRDPSLARDKDWKRFLLAWATDHKHAAAAGAAFVFLYEALPDDQDVIWTNATSADVGTRVPLMLQLMSKRKWPAKYRGWWMSVYDREKSAVPDLDERLCEGDLGTFASWANEETNPGAASAIRAVFERLKGTAARKKLK